MGKQDVHVRRVHFLVFGESLKEGVAVLSDTVRPICDSRTHFRIHVGHRPRAVACRSVVTRGHRRKTVPFFVPTVSTGEAS